MRAHEERRSARNGAVTKGELGDGASASSHSSDRSGSDDRDDGGSDGNSPNDENTYGENGWTSGWSERNGGDEPRSDCVQTGGRTRSSSTPPLLDLELE